MEKNNLMILSTALFLSIMIFTGANCSNSDSANTNGKVKNAQDTIKTNKLSAEKANEELAKLAITIGPEDAKTTIIEASDLECPACKSTHTEFAKTVDKYKDSVKFGYLPYPLSYHPNALLAAYAIEAANLQEKGWEMHDKLFEAQTLDENSINTLAQELELNMDQFKIDIDSDTVKQKINDSKALLDELGLTGTPTFYINGIEYQRSPSFANLSIEIEK